MTSRRKSLQTSSTSLRVGTLVWVTDETGRRPDMQTGQGRVLSINTEAGTVDVEVSGMVLENGALVSRTSILSGVPRSDLRTPNAFSPFD